MELETVKGILNNNDITPSEIGIFYRDNLRSNYHNRDEFENNVEIIKAMSKYNYEFVSNKYSNYLEHYFRHLYNILKYVKEHEKIIRKFGGDPEIYAGLLQARMSAAELFVLFYDGLKFPKMAEYIERYCLIQNLAKQDLIHDKQCEFYKCKMKER